LNVLKLAWRNVWRNRRRTGITIGAMVLALVMELLYSGMVGGLVAGMEDDVVEFDLGDVQVLPQGYLTRPSIYDTVPETDAIIDELEAAGYRAAPRLYGGGLAGAGDASSGVQLVGLDPVRDARTLALSEAVGQGEWLDPADPTGVLVGRGLARTLDVGLGDEIVVLSQGADGSVANELFHVRGILMSVAASMDRGAIVMPAPTFREMMVLPEGGHRIIVRRPEGVELLDARAQVAAIAARHVPADGLPVDTMTWRELNPMLATYLQSVESVVVVFYFIIYFAVGILILNAMLMAVFERIREFGVLKAIGYGPLQVLGMMVAEGMLQALVATVAGLVLAAPGMWYLSTYGIDVGILGGMAMAGLTMPAVWMGAFTVQSAITPIVMLFFISFGAVIYPAVKAARIAPVEAMHHQ
jgi:putative ABC transport system permease protein